MLSKAATMLLGIINYKPLNAYEIIKQLEYMNVKWWFQIADSTVYSTLRNIEKKGLIQGAIEKSGNMPNKTMYCITENGSNELKGTLRQLILSFEYNTNTFSIALFFIDIFDKEEKKQLLATRLKILQNYANGINNQLTPIWKEKVSQTHTIAVMRMLDIVKTEISSVERLIKSYERLEEF